MDTRTELNVISICSGLAGLELGLDAALAGRSRTVCYIENEISAASILAARMEDGSLDQAPIWTDLRTFDPEPWRGRVDILAGGFPCQPHSVAGNKLGEDDPRELSGEVIRIANGLGLPILFLENVPGILRFYWDNIRPKLREMGYEIEEGLFSASETGAPHRRERLFILAHAECERGQGRELYARDEPKTLGRGEASSSRSSGKTELANAGHAERQGRIEGEEGGEGGTRSEPASQGSELAHAERGAPERCGHEVAPASRGVEGEVGELRLRADTGDGGNVLADAGLPLYPPGPNAHAGWAWLLARWPGLAPTYCREGHDVQPEMPTSIPAVLRGPHGATTGVDRRLRAIGNGVVPAVAALAYRELAALIGREEC